MKTVVSEARAEPGGGPTARGELPSFAGAASSSVLGTRMSLSRLCRLRPEFGWEGSDSSMARSGHAEEKKTTTRIRPFVREETGNAAGAIRSSIEGTVNTSPGPH